jgi:pyroglutamyl-peptidase
MTRILLTGFEPFGSATINPSGQLVHRLAAEDLSADEIELITEILPVAARHAPAIIEQRLIELQPDYCVMLGLAEGRAAISIERVAINLLDFRIPDNANDQPIDEPVVLGGPEAYFNTLPVRTMRDSSIASGIPTELSLTAGAFVCNQVFYRVQHFCAANALDIQSGFIHLPATPEMAAQAARPIPSMSLDAMVAGLRVMLGVIVREQHEQANPTRL